MMRWITICGFMLVLGGCATPALVPSVPVEAKLTANWTLEGRIGIKTDEQSLSGTLYWQHREYSDELLLTSPLGQGVARIVINPGSAMLEMPNQPVRRAPDVESLTREALGYPMPVLGLTWWLQALPAPGHVSLATRDTVGRLVQLKQDGWVVDYLQYAADAPERPRKLTLSREGLEIRLVADNWTVE